MNQALQQLADAIDEVFFLISIPDRRHLYVSAAYERMWGRPRRELEQSSDAWVESVHPEDRPRMLAALADLESAQMQQFRIHRPDGSLRWIERRVFPIRDGNTVVRLASICIDVTQNRLLEDQLRQSQKLESLGMLAGGVAHDFNNVLAVISSCAEILDEELTPAHPQYELVEEVALAVRRATALTTQLLAFSRKQVVDPVVLDLNLHVKEMRKMLVRVVGKIPVTLSLDPDLLRIKIDPGQLTQVLLNLAVNARDAMPDGGVLEVTTRNHDGKVVLSVRDTGTGMSAEVAARLFEPFFTTKERGKGTGMGLAVVHGVVDQAGAKLEVESDLGNGSTFRIQFPAFDLPVQPPRRRSVTLPDGNETILIVDDDAFVRKATARALRKRGYKTLEVSCAPAALRALDKHAIALLLTNVMLPNIDGHELCEIARAAHPALKIVYMSGYTEDPQIFDGDVELVEKPFKVDQLAHAIRRALASQVPGEACGASIGVQLNNETVDVHAL